MGKSKRGRCVKKNTNVHNEPEELTNAPHSFVINKGLPDGDVFDLTKDFRKVMEPFTASSLKVRKNNTIKDFVSVAGFLHVSHLCVFTRTELGVYFKTARLPRGPTLTFKVHNFSLVRDVISSLKRQLVVEEAFKHSPLIILNSFSGEGMQMKLMASMFQNMFPTINLNDVDLNSVRRCVLMNYNPTTKLIDFRHYNIKVIPAGISKGVKKVVQGKVPNLAKCNDISEFLTKSGILSESEFEDDPSHHVTLSQKLISRGNMEEGKSAIRLSELGPRLTLQLIKIEDGLMDGEVLYHDLIHKSEEEKAEIKRKLEMRKKLKEKRKKIQEENKTAKDVKMQELKEKSLKGMEKPETAEHVDDDAEYFREEVGEEPDKELFTKSQGTKRPMKTHHSFNNKKPRLDKTEENKFGRGSKHINKKFGGDKDKKWNSGKDKDKKWNRGKSGNDKDKKWKSGKDKKFGGKFREKSNAHLRDHRPIGGGGKAGGRKPQNKFKRK